MGLWAFMHDTDARLIMLGIAYVAWEERDEADRELLIARLSEDFLTLLSLKA
jgi:hypothetical protein